MASPPVLGRALLWCLVPATEHEYVSGDLLEEFRERKRSEPGGGGAAWWYVSQAARSAGPFMALRLRRGELLAELAVAQLVVVVAVLALDAFWGVVLGQVPLRAGAVSTGSELGSAAACAVFAAVASYVLAGIRDGRGRVSPAALCVFVLPVGLAVEPLTGLRAWVAPGAWTAGLGLGALAGAWLGSVRGGQPASRSVR